MKNTLHKQITLISTSLLPRFLTLLNKEKHRNPKKTKSIIRNHKSAEKKLSSTEAHIRELSHYLTNPQETFATIRKKLERSANDDAYDPISLIEISALMKFWHSAYRRGAGYANPDYVMPLLDITKELMQEARAEELNLNFHYAHTKLMFDLTDMDYESLFAEQKKKFLEFNSSSLAEIMTRPLAYIGNSLNLFSAAAVIDIFSSARLEKLLPLATKGAGAYKTVTPIPKDMQIFLPECTDFRIGGLTARVFPEPFSLLIEADQNIYIFETDNLITLFLFSENDHILDQLRHRRSLKRNDLQIILFHGEAIIKSCEYRLNLAEAEFMGLREGLKNIMGDPRWAWLLKRLRNIAGDF